MAKTTSKAPAPVVEDDWKRRVSFDFGSGKGGMEEPKGFNKLTVDQEVTVLVTGKVNSVRTDRESSGFSLVMDKIELKTRKSKGNLAAALDGAREARKL